MDLADGIIDLGAHQDIQDDRGHIEGEDEEDLADECAAAWVVQVCILAGDLHDLYYDVVDGLGHDQDQLKDG